MTDLQIEIKEIKATLKAMQEDIKRLESYNFQFYPSAYKYSPEIPTQGCSQEELMYWKGDSELSKSKHKTWTAKAEDIDPALMTPSYHCTYEHP